MLRHFSMSPFLEWSATVLRIRQLLLTLDPDRHHFPSMLTVPRWCFIRDHLIIQIRSWIATTYITLRSLLQTSLDCVRQLWSGKDELITTVHLINDWVLFVGQVANCTNCGLLRDLHAYLRAELWCYRPDC